MTLNELKTKIKSYLITGIESGNFTLNDEFGPQLQQEARRLGLSDADLQRLINIVSKELNPDEILEEARRRRLSEEIPPLPPIPEVVASPVVEPEAAPPPITNEDEAANRRYEEALAVLAALEQKEEKNEQAPEQPQEEEKRRLEELRARGEAIARKKAEEEAVERHNRPVREKQQAKNYKLPPKQSSGETLLEAKKPTFEGRKKSSDTDTAVGGGLVKKIIPLVIAFMVLGGGGIAAFFWYKNKHSSGIAPSKKTETVTLPSFTGSSNLIETDVTGTYSGTVTNRGETEVVQIEIYDVKTAVNQRLRFQFRGKLQQRRQNMQGFGEMELSKGTIYMGHRLMGDAAISKADDGTVTIQGANFQLAKKP